MPRYDEHLRFAEPQDVAPADRGAIRRERAARRLPGNRHAPAFRGAPPREGEAVANVVLGAFLGLILLVGFSLSNPRERQITIPAPYQEGRVTQAAPVFSEPRATGEILGHLSESAKVYYSPKVTDPCWQRVQQKDGALNGYICSDPKAYVKRGERLFQEGRYEDAIREYDQAIALNPNDGFSYANRGRLYGLLGDDERSRENLSRAVQLKPQHATMRFERGIANERLGRYTEALEDYSHALRLRPDYAEAYGGRGNAYAGLGEHERAIADYTEAIRLRPDAADYLNRGIEYAALDELDAALADFTEALRLRPEYDAARQGQRTVLERLNRQARVSGHSAAWPPS